MESVKELAKVAEKGKAAAGAVDGLSLSELRSELRSFGATLSECAGPGSPLPQSPEVLMSAPQ